MRSASGGAVTDRLSLTNALVDANIGWPLASRC
jgi:hypothetical protein